MNKNRKKKFKLNSKKQVDRRKKRTKSLRNTLKTGLEKNFSLFMKKRKKG